MNWPLKSLNEVTDKIGSGVTPKGGDSVYINTGTALIRSQNVYNSEFTNNGLVFIDEKTAQKMDGVTVYEDDVLLNITGDSVARCCLVDRNFLPARVNQHVSIIRTKKNILNPNFLTYFLVSPYMQSNMLSWSGNGGTRKALTKNIIEGFKVPVPPFDVQHRVVSILKPYDLAIENNRRRIQLLEDAARLLYREWFIYLRFPGHEHVKIVDGVPEGWHKQRLDDVAVINAESLKSNFQGRIEYIDISCVSTDSIDSTNWYEFEDAPGRARRILRDKDIIWSCVRPNRKSHAFIWQPHDRLIASTGFAVISAKTISPFFLYQTLSTSEYVGYLTNNAGGVAYPAVTAKVFEDSIILVPPNSITDTFDSFVSKSYQQINLLQQANKKLIEARDLLLPRLMSGEISV